MAAPGAALNLQDGVAADEGGLTAGEIPRLLLHPAFNNTRHLAATAAADALAAGNTPAAAMAAAAAAAGIAPANAGAPRAQPVLQGRAQDGAAAVPPPGAVVPPHAAAPAGSAIPALAASQLDLPASLNLRRLCLKDQMISHVWAPLLEAAGKVETLILARNAGSWNPILAASLGAGKMPELTQVSQC